jgi:hypothetical protein
MVAGHFGFAALVKSRETKTPLWALMLACQWLDVIFIPLFAAHVETLEPVAGTQGGYGRFIIHADWTHSLVGALVLSALFGAAAAWAWGKRSGLVLGAVAFSHWLLDLLMHRNDLPLLPGGGGPHFGFGLWRWEPASIATELLLVVAGALLYYRAASRVADGKWPRIAGALLLGSGLLTLALNVMGV